MFYKYSTALLLLFVSTNSLSFSIDSIEYELVDGRTIVSISGEGFGSVAPPILYDKANYAYENGEINAFLSDTSNDQVLTGYHQKDGAIWSRYNGDIRIRHDDNGRYHGSSYYYGPQRNSNLHSPYVWPRTGTPVESDTLYVSWWFKQDNDTRYSFEFELSDVSSEFAPAENDTFIVDVRPADWTGKEEVLGRVIDYDPETQKLNAIFWSEPNTNRIGGGDRVLTLDSNGATATLSNMTRGRGSNKFIRVWESDGSEGTFRLSWTVGSVYVGDMLEHDRPDVTEKEWNHLEIFVDRSSKSVVTRVNGAVSVEGNYTQDLFDAGHSPTIGLIGFDASLSGLPQKIWMDDIYLHNEFQRIVLSNAQSVDDLSHYEIQYFSKWEDDAIEFVLNTGSLDRRQPLYLYLFNDIDDSNSSGIELLAPPSMSVPRVVEQ